MCTHLRLFVNFFVCLEPSEILYTSEYWGTRQQLLAGKVIGDWVDRENGPLDPIFGVILQPTAGND